MKLIYALVLTLLASAPGVARAGDAASFRSLGFSGNGKYYAFLEFGTQDGSGFAYADVSVVDVAKNTIARSMPRASPTSASRPARTRAAR